MAAAVVVAITVALSGCGDDGSTSDEPPPDRGSERQEQESLLQRRDAPPTGVADQVSFFGIGNGGCSDEPETPTVHFFSYQLGEVPGPATVDMGDSFAFCLAGFDPAGDVEVVVQRPDGNELNRTVAPPPNSDFPVRTLSWDPVPGDPLGAYMVTARQGAATASGKFTVQLASQRGLRVIRGGLSSLEPGDTVRIALTGFEANESVPIHIYGPRGESAQHVYLTTVAPRVDGDGQLLYELVTRPNDPEGFYYLRLTEGAEAREVEANLGFRGPVGGFLLGSP